MEGFEVPGRGKKTDRFLECILEWRPAFCTPAGTPWGYDSLEGKPFDAEVGDEVLKEKEDRKGELAISLELMFLR